MNGWDIYISKLHCKQCIIPRQMSPRCPTNTSPALCRSHDSGPSEQLRPSLTSSAPSVYLLSLKTAQTHHQSLYGLDTGSTYYGQTAAFQWYFRACLGTRRSDHFWTKGGAGEEQEIW